MRDDPVGDRDLPAHGVDGHQRTLEVPGSGKVIEQVRDGRDFDGLVRDAELRQCQPGIGGVSAQGVKGLQPLALACVRRDVFPSMAISSCRPGHSALIQSLKHRPNRIGSTRLISVRSQRSQGMPK